MRVEFQQTVIQTVNAERIQTNVGNPQVAESIQHMQKIAEGKESQKKTETIPETNKSEMIQPVEDEERKRKALLSQRHKKDKENKDRNDEKQGDKDESIVFRRLDRRI